MSSTPVTTLIANKLSPKNKFRAQPQTQDGLFFPSKKELRRWNELNLLQEKGAISGLRRQVRFPFKLDGKLMFTYVADFTYMSVGKEVVEDSKGFRTPIYKLKKKIIEHHYGIEILET